MLIKIFQQDQCVTCLNPNTYRQRSYLALEMTTKYNFGLEVKTKIEHDKTKRETKI